MDRACSGLYYVLYLKSVESQSLCTYKTKAITEMYCKKEDDVLLDESVVHWIEDNLQKNKMCIAGYHTNKQFK